MRRTWSADAVSTVAGLADGSLLFRGSAPPAATGAARARVAVLALAIAAITAVHLTVSVGTHREHVIHVLFRGLYLLPVIAGAAWFRLRGALVAVAWPRCTPAICSSRGTTSPWRTRTRSR